MSVLKPKSLSQAFSSDWFLFVCFSVDISVGSKYAVPDDFRTGTVVEAQEPVTSDGDGKSSVQQGSLTAGGRGIYPRGSHSDGA